LSPTVAFDGWIPGLRSSVEKAAPRPGPHRAYSPLDARIGITTYREGPTSRAVSFGWPSAMGVLTLQMTPLIAMRRKLEALRTGAAQARKCFDSLSPWAW
jgi:hypothetical protein